MEKKLLNVRKEIKRRKPNFVRADIHKNIGLAKKWRRPKGWQNKVRLCKRGKLRRVEIGFGSPKEVSGLSREGLKFAKVSNLSDLKKITKDDIVVISSTVGNRKRIAILDEVKKLNLKIYNYKNIDTKIDSIKKEFEKSKKNSESAKKRLEERVKRISKKEANKKEDKSSEKNNTKEEAASKENVKKVVVKKNDDVSKSDDK